MLVVFFFKQKTAYEMRISDWSSDVCSSDLQRRGIGCQPRWHVLVADDLDAMPVDDFAGDRALDIAALLHRQIDDHRTWPHRRDLRVGDDARCRPPRDQSGGDDAVDRKSGVLGKGVAVRVGVGGRSIVKHKKSNEILTAKLIWYII